VDGRTASVARIAAKIAAAPGRDRRRREPQGIRDGGDRPARVQLAQQAQTAEVEHHVATLLL